MENLLNLENISNDDYGSFIIMYERLRKKTDKFKKSNI